jgi:glc operon protein GlcG
MKNHSSLDHLDAQAAIGIFQSELQRRGKAAVIAVADDHGELLALLRVQGAPLPSIVIAANKAWTAAREGRPTFEIGQESRDPATGFDRGYYGDHRYVGWGGGVPVVSDGSCVGSVAVSGLTQEEDMELAALAAAGLAERAAGAS